MGAHRLAIRRTTALAVVVGASARTTAATGSGTAPCASRHAHPWCDRSRSVEHRTRSAVRQPQRVVGFASKTLGPGRSLIMHVDLTAASFRQYRHGHFVTTPGRDGIKVGDSSRHEPLHGVVRLRR